MFKSTQRFKKNNKKRGKNKKIYLDYGSATPLALPVLAEMNRILKKNFANANAIHSLGQESANILEDSRRYISQILGVSSKEIIFTSGATENNNLAIFGILGGILHSISKSSESRKKKEGSLPHIVTTNIEHPSVLEICKYLEKTKKAEVTFVPVEASGLIDPKKIKKAIKKNTVLVSIMYANNEIGTIQPIREIAKEIRNYKKNRQGLFYNRSFLFPVFYTDATQAVNYLPINIPRLGVDMLSFNGDKIYGPKDIGVLYVNKNLPFEKVFFGGNQEFDKRPGTSNIASIGGLRIALGLVEKEREKEAQRLLRLRDYFIDQFLSSKDFKSFNIILNGDRKERLPNNINITIPKIPSDLLVLELSARGIFLSEKTACRAGDKKGSYVIGAIREAQGLPIDGEFSFSLRFSLGRDTKKEDLDLTLGAILEILEKLKRWYN